MSAPSPIELLSYIAPVSDEEAARLFGEGGRERLLDAVTNLSRREQRGRRRLRRSLAIAVAAVLVVAAATGAGWALTRGSARETTSVDCLIQGSDTIIDATSGDPAADCAAVWPGLTGKPAPALTAYDNGLGGVTVLPSSQKAPAGWRPIASQDVALIQLQESFDDYVNGLPSTCFDGSGATEFARRRLDTLGLAGWTVSLEPGSPSTASPCVDTSIVEPAGKAVVLRAEGGMVRSGNWPPVQLAAGLRPLTRECLSLPAMRSAVEQRASSLGFSQTATDSRNYALQATEDPTMRCTTLYETIGGTIDLILRGPATR